MAKINKKSTQEKTHKKNFYKIYQTLQFYLNNKITIYTYNSNKPFNNHVP